VTVPYLPFNELVEVLGETAAIRLVAGFGGTTVFVPKRFRPESPIVTAIGEQAADRLAQHIATGQGGMRVELPRGPSGSVHQFRRRLEALCRDGSLSEQEVARAAGVTMRAVRYRRAKAREEADDAQGKLI